MKKFWIITLVVIIGLSSIAATPFSSTQVNESLRQQLDANGKWKSILFSDGTSQSTGGGGEGDVDGPASSVDSEISNL